MSRRSRIARYIACFIAGVAVAAGGYAVAAGGGQDGGRPDDTVSVRPTGVGLPLIGAHGTTGAADYVPVLRQYHDSGRYQRDLKTVAKRARGYLGRKVKRMNAKAKQRCRRKGTPPKQCRKPKPALVLDIDETALSNYEDISATGFAGTSTALSIAVLKAQSPPVGPTLSLFEFARKRGVAVFFITGRPDYLNNIRELTEDNLELAGYSGWEGLYLKPEADLGVVPYKSGARREIERKLGYRIVANVGDQESDLHGGFADRAFKLPNPYYFIADD